ncbi:hypothetical protein GCM10023340_41720 [Nocardioides marinquilinus]|uniref:Glucanase n=1 Tax=Nocardioides marinquilinus TaxID=1210400 RepID=A0ABP9Q1X8_9ACTN
MSRRPLAAACAALALLAGLGNAAPAPAVVPAVVPAADSAVVRTPAATAPAPATDPRRTRPLYVDPTSAAKQAGREFWRIGNRAQAMWLTERFATPTQVRQATRAYTSKAVKARRTAVLTVYGVPGRDCGGQSGGGLPTPTAYRAWVRGIAEGLKGTKPIVVVEPDAIAFMGDPSCADAAQRQRLLSYAAQQLSRSGAWVYLDAGHSDWRSAADTATLLLRSGVRYARGFSTNVSNYRLLADEQAWANEVLAGLRSSDVLGKKYVVDVSRNGYAQPVSGEWCNPGWARLGPRPALVFRGPYDGGLWIKRPGESDGYCNGGPAAGAWWPEGARRLLGKG